jgi:hypothetical protein
MTRMMMRAATALVLLATTLGHAAAQPAGLIDNQVAELRAKKQEGAVIVDVQPLLDGNRTCGTLMIKVRPPSGAWLDELTLVRPGKTLFGEGPQHGGLVKLPPNRYTITSITCGFFGSRGPNFEGPHASFEVRAGEVVDLGVLVLDYRIRREQGLFSGSSGTGAVRRSVTGMSPQARAELKAKMPNSVGLVVTRHMQVVGPPVSGVRATGMR